MNTLYKQWKLTEEDWRNRERWDEYKAAVEDMLLKTSTVTAPWTTLEGNDKRYARVKALRTLVDALSQELDHEPSGAKPRGKRRDWPSRRVPLGRVPVVHTETGVADEVVPCDRGVQRQEV